MPFSLHRSPTPPLRVLVTGGAGFVGSHLCDRLIAEGREVIALDDFSTGATANVAHLRQNPRFRLVRGDVAQPLHFDVDRIYNLACPASPPHYQRDPIRTVETNVIGMRNVLQLANRCGARVLQASTSEVYGDPIVHPQTESYRGNVSITGPRACYDEGKRCAEALCFDYRRVVGLDVRVARIFNTYGPRMAPDDGRVVSNFVTQALRGEPLTIYGDGRQTRSFCHVSDLVDGLTRLMEHDTHVGPINLGNPTENTMLELAAEVMRAVGSSSRLVRRPLPKDDPTRRRPDITLAREVLGFEPQVTLAQGLADTVAGFRRRLGLELTTEGSGVHPRHVLDACPDAALRSA